jgi:hypothetical protein
LISPELLAGEDLKRFDKVEKSLEEAYKQVINSLQDRSTLPYVPNLYPVAFMMFKIYKVKAGLTRLLFYSLAYPDVKDFDRFGIYITLSVIEKFPQFLPGLLGHEIAHVISTKGKVELSKSRIHWLLKDRMGYLQEQEKSGQNAYSYFDDKMQSKIRQWNESSSKEEVENTVVKDARLVSQQDFDMLVFGDRLADYHDFIRSKLRKADF